MAANEIAESHVYQRNIMKPCEVQTGTRRQCTAIAATQFQYDSVLDISRSTPNETSRVTSMGKEKNRFAILDAKFDQMYQKFSNLSCFISVYLLFASARSGPSDFLGNFDKSGRP